MIIDLAVPLICMAAMVLPYVATGFLPSFFEMCGGTIRTHLSVEGYRAMDTYYSIMREEKPVVIAMATG